MADGAANPYLATHAVLRAAMLGVEQGHRLPPAEDLDGIENVRATRHVPSSLKRRLMHWTRTRRCAGVGPAAG